MVDLLHRLTQLAEHAIGTVKVRSALNPCLLLILVLAPLGLGAAVLSDNLLIKIVSLSFVAVPILLFVFAYVFFMIKSPDKLRSEEFELRRLALSVIEEKGGPIAIAEVSVEAIANPEYTEFPKLAQAGDAAE
jgi:hypothetical protein